MPSLTITSKGQVTFRKEVLEHLGVKPGDKLEVDLLPNRRAAIEAKKTGKPIERLFGFRKKEGQRPLSLDEIDKIIEDGWAKRR
jgi:antitoxin PrlF